MSGMGGAVIDAQGVGRRFGGRPALSGIDLRVATGEIVGLVGPDGAGKTTLLQILAAILDPSEGRCLVLGFDTIREAAAVTSRIGLLVSIVARSQLAAMLLALIIALMPSLLFSGLLFPTFTMAYFSQLYARTLPTAYFVDLSRAIVLRGAGLPELWPTLALLFVYTLLIFALAVWRFRKKVG